MVVISLFWIHMVIDFLLLQSLNDGTPDVRDAAFSALAAMAKVHFFPYHFVILFKFSIQYHTSKLSWAFTIIILSQLAWDPWKSHLRNLTMLEERNCQKWLRVLEVVRQLCLAQVCFLFLFILPCLGVLFILSFLF